MSKIAKLEMELAEARQLICDVSGVISRFRFRKEIPWGDAHIPTQKEMEVIASRFARARKESLGREGE